MAFSRGLSIRLKIPTRVQPEVMPPAGKSGMYTNKIHHLKKFLLDELRQYDFAMPFMEPVDTEALNVPTYYTIIEQPMDMSTIIMRVKNRYYRNVDELISDIRLVISNCFTFNRPDALVYSDGQKLEKLFLKILAKLPVGEELSYNEENGERSVVKRQCRYRLKKLQDQTEQLEQDAQNFFLEKWSPLTEKLHNRQIKTLDEFDSLLDNILKHCHEHGRHIFESYEYEVNRPADEEENSSWLDNGNVSDEAGSDLWQCRKPEFDWEDSLIDALDDTFTCLKQDLVMARQGVVEKEMQSYSEALLPMFVNAQIIIEGLCSQTNLAESSDEEETENTANGVSEEQRVAIREQFHELSPEAMFGVMHIIEQAEFQSGSNTDRKYQVIDFSLDTINLIKKAIDVHCQSNVEETEEDNQAETSIESAEHMSQVGNDNDTNEEYSEDCSMEEYQVAIATSVPCFNLEYNNTSQWEGDRWDMRSDEDSYEEYLSDTDDEAELSVDASSE